MTIRTYTEAPEDYDGFGTRTLEPNVGTVTCGIHAGRPVRMVSTPLEHLAWQRARYSSGMYLSASQEQFESLTMGRYPVIELRPEKR